MARVWVFAEVTPTGVDPTALELLTKARDLGEEVDAVALGPGATDAVPSLAEFGAARVFVSDDEAFSNFIAQPAAHVLATLVEEHRPDLVLFAANYDSRDIAGRLSAKLGATLMSNAFDVLEPGKARTSALGGSVVVDVSLRGPVKLVLVRPKSFEARPSPGRGETMAVTAEIPADLCKSRRTERHEQDATGPKLEEAGVVIAGGRGLQGPEGFKLLDELAGAVGDAAVGATRAVVDAGWVPYAYQIGQTGATVKPGVYLAFGISGATQHIVGMKGAKRIVAINKDEDAPIFQIADLGVVGDALEILPRLIEEVKARKG